MENMKPRKIILMAACFVLLIICIVQGVTSAINPVKTLALDESPDFILIENASSTVELYLDGTTWYVGHNDFQAERASADSIVNSIKEVKVLDSIGKLGSDEFNDRFDLDGKACVVTAKKGEKILRTLRVGKTSSTGSQTYLNVDGSRDIYLVSGNLQSIFNKTEDSLKSKTVYSISASNINAVSVSTRSESFGIERNTSLEDDAPAWVFSGSGEEADSGKVDAWLNQLATCSATEWIDDNRAVPSEKTATVEISATEGKIVVEIFQEDSGDGVKYICTSSRTPHKFELSETACAKYKKASSELKK
ncbi:MAG: DUF4340 domain-containing protein [Treponema sp.]|nr:DUF4340 domain-containing protein [Treponema sp.]